MPNTPHNHHVVFVTDAWHPQVNGVVRTLEKLIEHLQKMGVKVSVISPLDFKTIPCPTYPEIRLALTTWRLGRILKNLAPDSIHIVTEGPLGLAARFFCKQHGWSFTSSYHTKFPEYLYARFKLPLCIGYTYMRWFHKASAGIFVGTQSLFDLLQSKGFVNLISWSRGVDANLFTPNLRDNHPPYPQPILLYVGRISIEKNIEDFLDVPNSGTKILVGEGPHKSILQKKYPNAIFLGSLFGDELAKAYANADVFVFPSRTDTFGLVLLEALACGTPVAAYPVTGPIDVITDPSAGILHERLDVAIEWALKLKRADCRNFALQYSWEQCAQTFYTGLCATLK